MSKKLHITDEKTNVSEQRQKMENILPVRTKCATKNDQFCRQPHSIGELDHPFQNSNSVLQKPSGKFHLIQFC